MSLPDKDVFIIDAAQDPPREIGCVRGVGTIIFNLAVNSADGRVYASNLEPRNHVRFEPSVRGHAVESRVTIVDGTEVRPVHLNPHIDYRVPHGPDAEVESSLALPLGMEFNADGKDLYVAAFGSGKVAVLDAEGGVRSRIEVGGGPSGLALHEAAAKLYVMNRFDHAISIVDLAVEREIDGVPLRYNPEPPAVREGRPFLYDARLSSGHGDGACASCHLFADLDSLAWDLGDPAGAVEGNSLAPVAVERNEIQGTFHPMKDPRTTQSLRGFRPDQPGQPVQGREGSMNRGLASGVFWGLIVAVSIHRSLEAQEPEALLDFETPAEIAGCLDRTVEFEAFATITPKDEGGAKKAEMAGGWNRMEILAIKDRICLVVNGQIVADWTDPKPELCQAGQIGLQLHSNHVPQEVHFRGLILSEDPEDKLATIEAVRKEEKKP